VITVPFKELETIETLPFDIYNKTGRLLFKGGDLLTPGKLLQLKYIDIYRKKPEPPVPQKVEESKPTVKSRPVEAPRLHVINHDALIAPKMQIAIKASMHKIMDDIADGEVPDANLFQNARDQICNDVMASADKIEHLNQLRIFDDYDYAHGINVSILSVMLGYRMNLRGSGINPDTKTNTEQTRWINNKRIRNSQTSCSYRL
jgi:hypothetical protein